MGTRRAITMPGLLWQKYRHLHQRRRITKEVTGPWAASVSPVTLTIQTKDCKLIAAPLPDMGCLRCQGRRHGIPCFSPQNQMPLAFIDPHLSVLSGSKTEQGGWGSVGLEPERPAFLGGLPASWPVGRVTSGLFPRSLSPSLFRALPASLSVPRTASSHGSGLHLGLLAPARSLCGCGVIPVPRPLSSLLCSGEKPFAV